MSDARKTATLFKVLDAGSVKRFGDGSRLYRCDPPMPGYEQGTKHQFVWASSAEVPYSGPETYLFGADENGEVTNWMELEGSRKGRWSHARCFAEAGYELVGEKP